MSSVCRICLAGNSRLYDVKNKQLLLMYENLTNSKFNAEDARSRALCPFCYQKLLRCHTFSQMALRSEIVISHIYEKGLQVNHEHITEVKQLNMKQHLSVATMPILILDDNATKAGSQVIVKDEPLPSIDIKKEVTTEPDTVVFEDCTKSQETLKADNGDQGDDAEELLFNSNIEHTKPDNSKMPFICNNCNTIFYIKSKLISHIRQSHSQPKGKQYTSSRKHTSRKQEAEDPFGCNVCEKKFSRNYSLVLHKRTHTGEKPFACNVCHKKFNFKCFLVQHMRTHTGEKPFACNVCDKQFSMKQNCVNHMRTHTGEKPFACNVCLKQFNLKNYLVAHMKIHTGEKPFACNVCDKQFIKKQYFVHHMRTHTGEKPFACNVCDKQFSMKQNCVHHMRTHTGEKPFACNVCLKQFNRKNYLVAHMKIHTEKLFVCNVCHKQFSQKDSLVDHLKIHTGEKPFACNVCDKQFIKKQHFILHTRTHTGEKPFACHVCDKKFNLKHSLVRHMRTHTGEKPFACNVCNKIFNRKDSLFKHNKICHERIRIHGNSESGMRKPSLGRAPLSSRPPRTADGWPAN